EVDVHAFGEEIAKAFESIVDANDIEFVTQLPTIEKTAWFDARKVDKIVYNLLSNAFKFTPAGGRIEFKMQVIHKNSKLKNFGRHLLIEITDTGKGIEPEMLDKVFERFFQTEGDNPNMHSSGIGL